MNILSRGIKSINDSFVLSVRFTRRTATVTISAPDAACARAISGKLRYFPVPTISRDANARPAMTSWSDIFDLNRCTERSAKEIVERRDAENKFRKGGHQKGIGHPQPEDLISDFHFPISVSVVASV